MLWGSLPLHDTCCGNDCRVFPWPASSAICRRWFLLSARKREDDRSVLHLVEKCRLWGFSFNPPTIDGCTISWLMIDPHLKVRVSCSSFFLPTPPPMDSQFVQSNTIQLTLISLFMINIYIFTRIDRQ